MKTLTFLGTAIGAGTASNTTALLIEEGQTHMLLDTSGGHEIQCAFKKAGRSPLDTEHIFISHWDADHILGIVSLMSVFRYDAERRKHTIYCSRDVQSALESLFTYTAHRHYEEAKGYVHIDVVTDGDERTIGDWKVRFFDLKSKKTPQFGCKVTFSDGKMLMFCGDEPMQDHIVDHAKDCDVLVHEAYCTSDMVDIYRPYEKHHGTAKDAGAYAKQTNAAMLVLVHMEDDTLTTRKELYLQDVRSSGYGGKIFVPVDQDVLEF